MDHKDTQQIHASHTRLASPAAETLIPCRFPAILLSCLLVTTATLTGCSMKEEIRRIEAVKQAQEASEAARSTNLTGEQIFMRSCNTCHPSGKKGFGPSLIDTDEKYKTDAELITLLRQGKGIMPPQPPETLNDQEMKNLVSYVRRVSSELKQPAN